MKRFAVLLLALAMTVCCAMPAFAAGTIEVTEDVSVSDDYDWTRFKGQNITLNVYNWGEYISNGSDDSLDVVSAFEDLTGIKVNYTTYASNEDMFAKLSSGAVSFDVVIPSDYMISKMIKEDMLEPLNFDNIPNFSYIMPTFVDPAYDPDNAYSVPYTWGTVGLIYNTAMIDIPKEDIDWDILWNEDYADQILMFDNPRDAFAISEIMMGYSINTEDPVELTAAANKLKEQKAVVQAYVMDEIFDKMAADDAWIAPYYAGDALTILEDNEDLDFVVPKSGTNLFVDAMCIPKGSRQKEAAEMYINFMCEPDIAYSNIDYICYSTPHSGAYEMLDEETRSNPVSYPGNDYLDENTTIFVNLSDEANLQMQTLWTEMKSAENETPNRWIVPVFLLLCLGLMIFVLIRRHIRNKKDIY